VIFASSRVRKAPMKQDDFLSTNGMASLTQSLSEISAAAIPHYEGGIHEHQRSPW
jgi:hypothetical protein